jgi:uncharacterized repeat protein (TIGR02543 family)
MKLHPRGLILAALLGALACGGSNQDDVAGPENTLQITVVGSGSVRDGGGFFDCPAVRCLGDATPGLTIELTATAAAGKAFVGWSGACASAGANLKCSVTINGHVSVTATFTL